MKNLARFGTFENTKSYSTVLPVVMKKFAIALMLLGLTNQNLHALALNQAEQQIIQLSDLLQKIAENPEVLKLILDIRDGMYGPDGELFKSILVAAAKERSERDAFIAGLQYEKCRKWFWNCGLPPISWDKIKFKLLSKLKSNLDLLEQKIVQLGNFPENYLSDFDPRSLDPYENYFQLFAESESDLGSLISFLFGFYTNQSLRDLNQNELQGVFEKQISFLNDKENGAIGFIRKARPRS